MNGGEEGCAVFGVSCGDAAPSFEVQKSLLYQMAQFVEILVVISLVGAVLSWRNDRVHLLFFGLLYDFIAIIAAIREKMIGVNPLNQADSLRTICSCTLREKDSDRHTMRIHGQMYFCVEPPFVRLLCLS